jgi:hypothetical protein
VAINGQLHAGQNLVQTIQVLHSGKCGVLRNWVFAAHYADATLRKLCIFGWQGVQTHNTGWQWVLGRHVAAATSSSRDQDLDDARALRLFQKGANIEFNQLRIQGDLQQVACTFQTFHMTRPVNQT